MLERIMCILQFDKNLIHELVQYEHLKLSMVKSHADKVWKLLIVLKIALVFQRERLLPHNIITMKIIFINYSGKVRTLKSSLPLN